MDDPAVFKVLSGVVFIGATLFIAVFLREPWHRHQFGRSLMMMAAALWLFSLTSVLRQWLGPDYWGRTEIRIVAQTLVACAIWSRLSALLKARRADSEETSR